MEVDRRNFLKALALAAGQWMMSDREGRASIRAGDKTALGRQPFGRTGREVSRIGMGGIVVMNAEPARARKTVAEAVERGVNYFDVAPSYGDAELKLGPALKPFRNKVFLACKTVERGRENAEKELHSSLKRLQTDHFDLYQLHAVTDVEKDVHAALGKGGAMEAILAARKQGLVRHIGFTAHSPQAAMAALKEFDFDAMMYPVNFCTHFRSGFEVEPLKEAKKRNMGIIAIKAMARQKWPEGTTTRPYTKCWYEPLSDPDQARLALYWTLSQGVTVALPPGEEPLFRMALNFAPEYRPLTEKETASLKALAQDLEPIFPPRPAKGKS